MPKKPTAKSDPMNDTKFIQMDAKESEAELDQIKKETQKKAEEIHRKVETCLKRISKKV